MRVVRRRARPCGEGRPSAVVCGLRRALAVRGARRAAVACRMALATGASDPARRRPSRAGFRSNGPRAVSKDAAAHEVLAYWSPNLCGEPLRANGMLNFAPLPPFFMQGAGGFVLLLAPQA